MRVTLPDGRELFATTGFSDATWFIAFRKPNGSLQKYGGVKSTFASRELAEAALREYAARTAGCVIEEEGVEESVEEISRENSPAEITFETTRVVVQLPVGMIDPSPYQRRADFDAAYITELADSIRTHGLLQPITVRGRDGRYELIAGECRLRASREAGLETIAAQVMAVDDREAMELVLVENLRRRNLGPLEEAASYRMMLDAGYTQREIARRIGCSEPAISNALRLLALPDPVQERIRVGELTASHGRALLRFSAAPALVIEHLAEKAVADGMSSKALEQLQALDYQSKGQYRADKLLVELDITGTQFDWAKICRDCPSYTRTERDHYCWNPACWDEQQEAEQARRLAERTAEVEATLTRTEDLPWNQYMFLDAGRGAPAGCREDCEHRRAAIDRNDKARTICMDKSCFDRLQAAQQKAEKRALHERIEGRIASLPAFLEGLTPASPAILRMVVQLTQGALTGKARKAYETAAAMSGLPAVFFIEQHHTGGYLRVEDETREALAHLDLLTLLKFAFALYAQEQVRQALGYASERLVDDVVWAMEEPTAPPAGDENAALPAGDEDAIHPRGESDCISETPPTDQTPCAGCGLIDCDCPPVVIPLCGTCLMFRFHPGSDPAGRGYGFGRCVHPSSTRRMEGYTLCSDKDGSTCRHYTPGEGDYPGIDEVLMCSACDEPKSTCACEEVQG